VTRKPSRLKHTEASISFNHVLIYVSNLKRSLSFYADLLGFELLEVYPPDYARLRSLPNDTTIALHASEDVGPKSQGSVRLFFEIKDLDRTCTKLKAFGVEFMQEPLLMPWGWKHAFLLDPDGHEISLYWAGVKRLRGRK